MKLLITLFPINLYLRIFQLEGYDILRFAKWLSRNIFVRDVSKKKRLVTTLKTKLLLILSGIVIATTFIVLYLATLNLLLSLFVSLIISTQFYLPLIIARAILYPFEQFVIQRDFTITNQKIKSLKNLKVIAITGSYGKTSVKEFLYQLIKAKYKTLRTPESYNTTLGISKVVDYELDNSYEFFICEMAAYHRYDIHNLCKMVPPTYGILTGITSQHLERFGNLDNIVQSKFELCDSVQNKGNVIFNLNDNNVAKEVGRRKIDNPLGYFKTSNLRFSKTGSNFDIIYNNKRFNLQTSLFGISNIENLAGAITMAIKVGVGIDNIKKVVSNLTPVPNRFALKHLIQATIVDNTFSSNEHSFKDMVETAKLTTGTKTLVTPGLVELGNKEEEINSYIGLYSEGVFDKTILVGNNPRTRAFAKKMKVKPEFISDTRKDYFEKIEELSKKYDWIFLENDVTENY
jgi:UDP-N-acetylmuramoyl-tripeptide--D-alanyl-D-alanine ligase